MADSISEQVAEATLSAGESLSDAGVDLPAVSTQGADSVYIYVNDGAGGKPASYELQQDVADSPIRKNPTWDPHDTVTASDTDNSVSWMDDPVPWAMRVDIVNRSGSQDAFRVRVVAVQKGGE